MEQSTGDAASPEAENAPSQPPAKRARKATYSLNGSELLNYEDGRVDTEATAGLAFEEPAEYPRRRAMIACSVCRSRKSRCDGAKPKCKLCLELGAECVYRDPGVKLDARDKLILDKLTHIEDLLQSSHRAPPAPVQGHAPTSPTTSVTASEDVKHVRTMSGSNGASAFGMPSLDGMGTWQSNISTMPKSHTTPAMHLLQWPVIRDLVSRPCDPQTLLQLELDREPLDLSEELPLNLTYAQNYVEAFFSKVNVWYAVVNPYSFVSFLERAQASNFDLGSESCMVLLVLALGEAASSHSSISAYPHVHPARGMSFFSASWKLLPGLMIENDVLSAQCYVLAAAYLMYLVRPLEAWNLLSNASMKMQLLLSSPVCIPSQMQELSERVFWNALLIESDLLAELDLPHTGIVQFEEGMRLPRSFPYDTAIAASLRATRPPGSDDIWYFLAEVALRRLLNRVSHTIYTHRRTASIPVSVLEPMVAELDAQLRQWYDGLPSPIQFPMERVALQNPVQAVLRLRYFACRTIIFRRHVLAVLADGSVAAEAGVQDACRKCLEACIRQLENIEAHQHGHFPYLWQGALSVFSQALLVMGATLSNALRVFLPPAHQVDIIIGDVVSELQRLAHLAPSLQSCAEILFEAEQRRRARLGRRSS